jgi:hypothetical protein
MHAGQYPEVGPDFGSWLAGFIDGEGCFIVARGGGPAVRGSYYCRFQLKLRDDDVAVLHEIASRTGMGRVVAQRTRMRQHPQAVWQVVTRRDCAALVALLRRYPLRAKKAVDLDIWAVAVRAWDSVARGAAARDGANADAWATIEAARIELAEVRTYR